jgi:dehydrogenase/reductase SDR family protein 7B
MGAAQSSDLPDSTKQEYQNKSILITGASRGLGRSLAKSLSSCNPSLLVLSGRDEVALSEVKEECLQIDNGEMKVEIVVCNLADKSSVDKLATSALQLSRRHTNSPIDILINNGGISSRSSFLQTKLEVDEQLMQVNFFSGAALAKSLVPGMAAKKRGKIVWISSVQGKLGTPYRTSYAASKFAVQGYCEALRSELSSNNISVHIASPGYIRTNLSVSAVMGDGKAYSKMDETTANGADPDDVACTILNSVAKGESDFVVAATFAAKAALWLKFLLPSLLESKLVKRFEKGEVEAKKTE